MRFSVHILGSGSCVPSKSRAASGYLMNVNGSYSLFDGGSGTLGRIAAIGVDYRKIKNIFYTHFHVDHTADLLPLLFARKNDPSTGAINRLNIFGPKGLKEFLIRLDNFAGEWVYTKNDSIKVVELEPLVEHKENDYIIIPHATYHQPNSLGYRVETKDRKTFSYTGDTDEGKKLIDLLKDADLAIAECSFPDNMKTTGHLTPISLGRLADAANIDRLLLTHMYPSMDAIDPISIISQIYSGNVELGKDLKEYMI